MAVWPPSRRPPRQLDELGNEILELGAHQRGILEELEKAHVYIEQLDTRNREQQRKIRELEARLAALEERLNANASGRPQR